MYYAQTAYEYYILLYVPNTDYMLVIIQIICLAYLHVLVLAAADISLLLSANESSCDATSPFTLSETVYIILKVCNITICALLFTC